MDTLLMGQPVVTLRCAQDRNSLVACISPTSEFSGCALKCLLSESISVGCLYSLFKYLCYIFPLPVGTPFGRWICQLH